MAAVQMRKAQPKKKKPFLLIELKTDLFGQAT